jgi:hypothetical protein
MTGPRKSDLGSREYDVDTPFHRIGAAAVALTADQEDALPGLLQDAADRAAARAVPPLTGTAATIGPWSS